MIFYWRYQNLLDKHRRNWRGLAAPLSGLKLIGNGYHGIGIPDCIARANDAVAALERA